MGKLSLDYIAESATITGTVLGKERVVRLAVETVVTDVQSTTPKLSVRSVAAAVGTVSLTGLQGATAAPRSDAGAPLAPRAPHSPQALIIFFCNTSAVLDDIRRTAARRVASKRYFNSSAIHISSFRYRH